MGAQKNHLIWDDSKEYRQHLFWLSDKVLREKKLFKKIYFTKAMLLIVICIYRVHTGLKSTWI